MQPIEAALDFKDESIYKNAFGRVSRNVRTEIHEDLAVWGRIPEDSDRPWFPLGLLFTVVLQIPSIQID